MDYRRAWHPGGTYFFTVNCLQRKNNDLLIRHIDVLRAVIAKVKNTHPFTIHGWVVLPEHMHCVIELPEGDADFKTRWMLIKMLFSKAIPINERRSAMRIQRRERGIWRRYWERLISKCRVGKTSLFAHRCTGSQTMFANPTKPTEPQCVG